MTRTVACLDHVIDGAINLRDLGGYRAQDGRTVRGGHVYRSAMTHHISRAGLGALREHLGVRTVLDLRNEHELAQDGIAPFVDHGITHHNAPIGAETLVTPAERLERIQRLARGEVAWAQLYIEMSERAGQAVRLLFELVAAEDATPLVFHCTGGRDRTGVAAALLLASLGVSDDDIAADYALTGELLRPHIDRFGRHIEEYGMTVDEWARLVDTQAEPMLAFLAELRRRYGSVEAYLDSTGVPTSALAGARSRLLAS